jgi:DNA polymerase-3 subunit delta
MGIYLFTGKDESMVRTAVHDLVTQLVGDADPTLMVDDFDDPDYELAAVVDAAQTLPFLTPGRVVIARSLGRFTEAQVEPLLGYLTDPLPSTDVVLVGGGGQLPKVLSTAVTAAGGHQMKVDLPKPGERKLWVAERFAEFNLRLDTRAADRVAAWLGEDLGRLDGIIGTMVSIHGAGSKIRIDDVEPFLGEAGGVPPWDLTNAIDDGRTTESLALLERMLSAGERHPLQVMAILHQRYAKLARLDGADAATEAEVARIAGVKSGYQARRTLGTFNALGGDGVRRALELLAAADLDLRGASALDGAMVLEILVARLSRLRPATRR